MKILKIELENINSLAGYWSIDFTDPSYAQNHNLFVICGDTGAGKSSILDAITLALYGRTPRQSIIYIGTGNEVMTRNTGYCMARVTYECNHVIYVSEWSQRRGRDKASGNLQAPEGLLYIQGQKDVPKFSGKTQKEGDLGKANAEIIQLDYDQFCRSIMLAQGEFSKFLESDEEERAEILEKLNGTENYRKIAQKADEHWTATKAAYEKEEQKLNVVAKDILSEEEIKNKSQQIILGKAKSLEYEEKIKELSELIEWYKNFEKKWNTLETANRALMSAKQELINFEPSIKRLDRGEKAKECKSSFEGVKEAQEEKGEKQKEKESLLTSSKRLLAETSSSKEQYVKCQEELKVAEDYYEQQKSLWNEVRELDLKLVSENNNVLEATRRVNKASADVNDSKKKLNSLNEEIDKLQEIVGKDYAYLNANSKDADIEKQLSGLKNLCEQYSTLQRNLAECNKELEEHENKKSNIEAENINLKQKCDENQEYIQSHKEDETLTQVIAKTEGLLPTFIKKSDEILELEQRGNRIGEEIIVREEQLADVKQKKEMLDAEKLRVFENDAMVVASIIQNHLKNGDKCPVCGSKEHPSCQGNVTETVSQEENKIVEDTAVKIRILNEEATKASIEFTKLEEKLKEDRNTKDEIQRNLIAMQGEFSQLEKSINELWRPWQLTVSVEVATELLNQLVRRNEEYKQKRTEYEQSQKLYEENSGSLQVEIEIQKNLKENLDRVKLDYSVCEQEILDIVSRWVSDCSTENIMQYYEILSNRAQSYKNVKERYEKGNQELIVKKNGLEKDEQSLEKLEETARVETENYHKFLAIKEQTEKARVEKFGTQDVLAVETKAKQDIDTAKSKKETADKEHRDAETKLTSCNTRLQEVAKQIEELEQKINTRGQLLKTMLLECDFVDEEDYQLAVITQEEIDALKMKKEQLQENVTALAQSVKDAEDALMQWKVIYEDRDGSDKEARYLAEREQADYQKLKEENDKAIYSLQRDIDDNHKKEIEVQQYLTALDAAEEEYKKWEKLHAWFGRKGGDQFSKFVQGLTFKSLLVLANKQLHVMKERYTLVAKGDLDLEIQDSYYDSMRSISNLSGGEKFLVSLALALGIADFASRNVKIENLFMDEGFGTLDSEKLEDVMDCLRSQQKKGKMLGIITHVDEVVNNIDQRITLTVNHMGHSTIVGQGVSNAMESLQE